jgi:hypothetical protein
VPRLGRGAKLALARRAGNLERSGLVGRLRCECALPGCDETVPALAESHRGIPGRYIVVPAHFGALAKATETGAHTVVRADDRFFVVDVHPGAGRIPREQVI